MLEQAIGRISSIAHLQQIIDDGPGHERDLAVLLRDLLDQIFYDVDVAVQVRSAPVRLSHERATILCLIAIEAATNSLRHIFRRRRGNLFAIELRRLPNERLMLTIRSDGPGFESGTVLAAADGQGLSIMQRLAAQLGGTLTVECRGGTTVRVEFADTSSVLWVGVSPFETKSRLPLLGERSHSLALIRRTEERHEQRALVPHALRQRRLECAIDRLLGERDSNR